MVRLKVKVICLRQGRLKGKWPVGRYFCKYYVLYNDTWCIESEANGYIIFKILTSDIRGHDLRQPLPVKHTFGYNLKSKCRRVVK